MPDKSVRVSGREVTIADMRSRVTFQTATRVSDSQGGFEESWASVATNPTVWGYLAAVSSRERLFSEQMQTQRSHVLVVRYRTDLNTSMRVSYDSRTFQIKGFRNPDERKWFLVLDLEENQGK